MNNENNEYSVVNHCLVSSIADNAEHFFSNCSIGIRNEVVDEIVELSGSSPVTKKYSVFPIDEFEGDDVISRLFKLLIQSLQPLVSRILYENYALNVHLHCVLPEKTSERSVYINEAAIHSILIMLFGNKLPFSFSTSYVSDGVVGGLKSCCAEYLLTDNDLLIFGAVDTLINRQTIASLLKKSILLTDEKSYGSVPGEAAGFIVLKKKEEGLISSSDVFISGMSALESNSDSALKNSICSALTQASISSENINDVVYSTQSSMTDAVNWHYTIKSLWPNILPDNLRVAVQLGEIDNPDNPNEHELNTTSSQLSIGDCGAVNLTLDIIYSIGKVQFDNALNRNGMAEVKPLLICNTQAEGHAGALCLQINSARITQEESEASTNNIALNSKDRMSYE